MRIWNGPRKVTGRSSRVCEARQRKPICTKLENQVSRCVRIHPHWTSSPTGTHAPDSPHYLLQYSDLHLNTCWSWFGMFLPWLAPPSSSLFESFTIFYLFWCKPFLLLRCHMLLFSNTVWSRWGYLSWCAFFCCLCDFQSASYCRSLHHLIIPVSLSVLVTSVCRPGFLWGLNQHETLRGRGCIT